LVPQRQNRGRPTARGRLPAFVFASRFGCRNALALPLKHQLAF